MEDRIKEIGKRARQRLELEKSKRKEIVRLDHLDVTLNSHVHGTNGGVKSRETSGKATKKLSKFSKAVKENSKVPGNKQKRKRKLISQQSINGRTSAPPLRKRKINSRAAADSNDHAADVDEDADFWSPSSENLHYYGLPRGETSNVVRIHGLPVGTKTEHIRRFFSGLSPERLFILPTLDVPIRGFDIIENDENRRDFTGSRSRGRAKAQKGIKIRRHAATFRVCVKFQHSATAHNSIARSGELIRIISRDLDNPNENGKSKTIAAAITVSPLSETVGRYLHNHMAIECQKGQSLSDVLQNLERVAPIRTQKVINEILWSKAAQSLHLYLKLDGIGGGDFPRVNTMDIFNIFPAEISNARGREQIIKLHNKLLDLYESLEDHLPTLQYQDLVERSSFSNINRASSNEFYDFCSCTWYANLMTAAANWLLDQMTKVQKCIKHK